jgi:hypothetical protein
MLPPGIAADALSPAELTRLRELLPAAQTAAHLRVGPCSCDLVRSRHPEPREDERELRQRYSKLGLPRERIIRELERHRRDDGPTEPPSGWRWALAEFVAEHARNAGPTLYHLAFHPGPSAPRDAPLVTRTVAEVRADPKGWLEEGPPIIVVR